MVAVTIVSLLVVSVAAFLGLWLLIEGETSNPTVMDREEAQRRAIEQGGRGPATNEDARDERSEGRDDDDRVGWDA